MEVNINNENDLARSVGGKKKKIRFMNIFLHHRDGGCHMSEKRFPYRPLVCPVISNSRKEDLAQQCFPFASR